jgi:hypothetical protein
LYSSSSSRIEYSAAGPTSSKWNLRELRLDETKEGRDRVARLPCQLVCKLPY